MNKDIFKLLKEDTINQLCYAKEKIYELGMSMPLGRERSKIFNVYYEILEQYKLIAEILLHDEKY